MPNLEKQAVMDWLGACEPAIAHVCKTPVRAVEDDTDIHAALVALGETLDDHASSGANLSSSLQAGEPGQDLLAILTQLGPARLIRLFHWLSSDDAPDRQETLRALLDDAYGSATTLRATLQALHRQALLASIFDESRLQALLLASRTAREETSV